MAPDRPERAHHQGCRKAVLFGLKLRVLQAYEWPLLGGGSPSKLLYVYHWPAK
jgi:hypothetical protein